jgi:hypothetical protein
MISLIPFVKPILTAIDNQVKEFAGHVVAFVELLAMLLFW